MFIGIIKECFRTIIREHWNIVKWTYQKTRYGICDAELWNFGDYLLTILSKKLKDGRKIEMYLKSVDDPEITMTDADLEEIKFLLLQNKQEVYGILKRDGFASKLKKFITMARHGFPAEFRSNEDWEKELNDIYYDFVDGKVEKLVDKIFTLWD